MGVLDLFRLHGKRAVDLKSVVFLASDYVDGALHALDGGWPAP